MEVEVEQSIQEEEEESRDKQHSFYNDGDETKMIKQQLLKNDS
jgi:hypothetical protein